MTESSSPGGPVARAWGAFGRAAAVNSRVSPVLGGIRVQQSRFETRVTPRGVLVRSRNPRITLGYRGLGRLHRLQRLR